MKFTVSSSELFEVLQYVGKAINTKQTMPILDYFLFVLKDNKLEITASDQETSQISVLEVSQEEAGEVAVPARLIQDSLKEFSDQPITIGSNPDTFEITIAWESGSLVIPGMSAVGYPNVKEKNEESLKWFSISSSDLMDGISKTIFAAADKNIRPIMNGIFFDVNPEALTFVATDAHKLVKLTIAGQFEVDQNVTFILPKKPAQMIRGFLAKESGMVRIEFDEKNIHFITPGTTIICRAIEGKYPNYNSVIPTTNKNKLVVDRRMLLNSVKRVSVCSDQSSNLVKLSIVGNNINLVAKDLDFSTSAEDNIPCSHDGEPIVIGFKSEHLIDMLSAATQQNISVELSDSTRAGLFIPVDEEESSQQVVMLLMPIMI